MATDQSTDKTNAKFTHTIEYVNKVINETYPFDSLPVWVRRRKFTAYLRTVLFEKLYEDIDMLRSAECNLFWERFVSALFGASILSEEAEELFKPSKEVVAEIKALRKAGKLEKLLPEFLSTFKAV